MSRFSSLYHVKPMPVSCPAPPAGIDVEPAPLLIAQAHERQLQLFAFFLSRSHPLLDRIQAPRLIQRGNNLCFCNLRWLSARIGGATSAYRARRASHDSQTALPQRLAEGVGGVDAEDLQC